MTAVRQWTFSPIFVWKWTTSSSYSFTQVYGLVWGRLRLHSVIKHNGYLRTRRWLVFSIILGYSETCSVMFNYSVIYGLDFFIRFMIDSEHTASIIPLLCHRVSLPPSLISLYWGPIPILVCSQGGIPVLNLFNFSFTCSSLYFNSLRTLFFRVKWQAQETLL